MRKSTYISIVILVLLGFAAFVFISPKEITPRGFVVLGYNLQENNSEEIMGSRVKSALSNCDQETDYVILSGGKEYNRLGIFRVPTGNNNSEAKKMEEMWVDNNNNCNVTLLLDENSYNTFENAYYSIKLARENGIKSLTVFTNKKHLVYAPFYFYLNKMILLSNIRINFEKVESDET